MADRRGPQVPPAAGSTVRKIHFILRGSLERAVRWRHLGVNKAAIAVTPPPAPSKPDPPTAEEAARMLSAAWASDADWGLLLWLTMVTGSRRGEVSALGGSTSTWPEVQCGSNAATPSRGPASRRKKPSRGSSVG